jgi:hypothetical protein
MKQLDWSDRDNICFFNEDLGEVDLWKLLLKNDDYLIATELTFVNCNISTFNSTCKYISKKVKFLDCKISSLICHATYFFGGFEIINSIISGKSTFDCGVHNAITSDFIITGSTFKDHVDFFDTYFDGPVTIVNNNFEKGTSLGLYINTALNTSCINSIENNKGDLFVFEENDPFKPKEE